ncbi:hypothetical protein [Erwinia rhapontici]|uniref:hypothetical protein n=1 Tax=Erwinia rhapontici TaxID=55212 RepID=UPI001BB33C5D|nr:hypothetical protein [Erwinia rhapontici]MCS3609844.1 hypothetical protein [Erwinia rhapontici]BCQ42060.1 hypothetical protein ERHA54_46630 [Erwinia rhapontici]
MKKIIIAVVLLLLQYLAVNNVFAYVLIKSNLASGYSDCELIDNNDGTSTAKTTISHYEAPADILFYRVFKSRALLFYTYSKSGKPILTTSKIFSLNNVPGTMSFDSSGYIILHARKDMMGPEAPFPWNRKTAFTAQASITFNNKVLSDWPAVSMSAGIFTSSDDLGDTKNAYISVGNNGSCKIITDPLNPPEPVATINITAPDWKLGEIKNGEQVIPFSARIDQLCLQYDDRAMGGREFIINATSQNGTVNNQYQLKGLQDNTQNIPYQLTLDSGSDKVDLPNGTLTALPLLSGGKTCFLPTFRTFAPKGIKKGDYSDVLTFNIVTKA